MTEQNETTATAVDKDSLTTETPATSPQAGAKPAPAAKKSRKRGRPAGSGNKKKKKTPAKKPAAKPKPAPAATETPATRGPGRPPGTGGGQRQEVIGTLTRCKKCESTERAPYYGTVTRDIRGIDPAGKEYNRITWRRTKCSNCQQARTDVFYELVSEA
ncbi:hypothetical protein [Paremcibacter congregatus]|uniref:hypothetical protein n=1 Tax=Paremcibacter congregatus TaxID=2043170 RepID=UPI003A9168BE